MNFADIFIRGFESRAPLFSLAGTNCFRLFNTAGDGLDGITVDRYGEYLLVQLFRESLSDAMDDILNGVMAAARRIPVEVKGVLVKNRSIVRGNVDYPEIRRSVLVEGTAPPPDYTVRQNGIIAAVDLMEGQSTGIFLDMREIRERLSGLYPQGGTILNLFSYTALFSMHALRNGMERSLNVDLSRTVLDRAMLNYRLNGLHCDNRDFIYGDAIQWMKKLEKRRQVFSFIVFDPPTFSRNRRKSFSVKKDYNAALNIAAKLLCGGYIFTAINSYSVSEKEYLSCHPQPWKPIFFSNESSDFPAAETHYLKAGLWKL
ncbi:MAG TPA: class I SAM-dependent methyltransferase [Spirochaetota bacterium]|nr:class I SAM-dependent methyltransferase [Spirochaetota bacterium]HPI88708.1 class I SAM-dependent methyltransferase [Spirochaetota bacterium]HPR48770.1 class I SAM-dependent methyltransferase [Spirochaetota bacterium]